jgi:hypothetical protein
MCVPMLVMLRQRGLEWRRGKGRDKIGSNGAAEDSERDKEVRDREL